MGNQCYYLGVQKETVDFARAIIQDAFEAYTFIYLVDDLVTFKQAIPLWDWGKEAYTDKFTPEEDEVFLVVQGDRFELNQALGKVFSDFKESLHAIRTLSIDNIQTDVYLTEYEQKNYLKPFENDYVKIT